MSEQPELHVLLTTVGTGSYKRARYEFAGESAPRDGELFPALLCDYLSARGTAIQKAVVLLTSEAKEHENWRGDENAQVKGLKQHLEERGIEPIEADIKNGNNEEELWEIFKAVGKNVPEGARVTLDITHGFRSLPLVMLLACAYHNASGDSFKLKGVYYGAFVKENEPAQAVDMTPMLTLFEWASAVDAFKRSGSLRQMAELLAERQKELYREQVVDRRARLPLRPIADQMSLLTEAIELGRVESFAEPVRKIRELSDEVYASAERWAKPFVSQIKKVLEHLDHFQVSMDEPDVNKWLEAQFGLVVWYSRNGFHVHAGLLLREWFISYIMSRLYPEKLAREIYEERALRQNAINRLRSSNGGRALKAELDQKLAGSTDDLWEKLAKLRNDVAHVGHHVDTSQAGTIRVGIEELIEALRPLVPSATPSAPSGEPAAPAE